MEILDFLVVCSAASVISISVYVIIQRIFCQGYAPMREIRLIRRSIEDLEDNFTHFKSKYTMRDVRGARAEQSEQLKAAIPALLEKLPLSDEQKAAISMVPPDLILGLIKKYI